MSVSVLPKRNIVIPSPDGKTSVRLNKDIIAQVPDWVPKTAYFKALTADKKLFVMTGGKKGRDKRIEEESAGKDEMETAESNDGSENTGKDQELQ